MGDELRSRHRSILTMVKRLGLVDSSDNSLAVYHLHEIDGIMHEVRGLLATMDREAKENSPSASRLSSILATIEVEAIE